MAETLQRYLSCAKQRGNGVQTEQRAALRRYVCCGVSEVEACFDALVRALDVFACEGRHVLWRRVGLGTLALVDVSLRVVKLDPSKMRFVFHQSAATAAQCVAHLRFHAFAWSVADAKGVAFHAPFATTSAAPLPVRRRNLYPIITYRPFASALRSL